MYIKSQLQKQILDGTIHGYGFSSFVYMKFELCK